MIFSAGIGLALLVFVGCGGGGGGSCSTPAACGGNIVGTWKVASSCISTSGSGATPDCPQQMLKISNYTVSGTVTYNADMTYTATRSLSGDTETTLPASCLMFQGTTVTCAQLQAAITSDPTSGYQSVTCTAAASGCTCSGKIVQDNLNETGTFSTAGNVLTETATGGQPSLSDYCVQGGTKLQIMPHVDMTMPVNMGDLSITGSITFAKQ